MISHGMLRHFRRMLKDNIRMKVCCSYYVMKYFKTGSNEKLLL
jgi:hypothetical protein